MARKTEADNVITALSDAAESHEIMKRNTEKNAIEIQRLKEEAIANVFETAGKLKAMNFVKTQADFFNLVMLKQIKDSKEYRERFGMTWESFCEHVGVNRRWIDEKLADLKPFKSEFLEAFLQFSGVGINKIKYLGESISGGTSEIKDGCIIHKGDIIPIDQEHREEVQALFETLEETHKAQLEEKESDLATKNRLLKDKEKVINRQARDLAKYEKRAEAQGLTPEEDAFLQRMSNTRTAFDGYYMCEIDPARMEELFNDASPTPRMIAAYLTALDYMRKQILVAYDAAVDRYGDPAMCPEEAWKPGMGAAVPGASADEKTSKSKK